MFNWIRNLFATPKPPIQDESLDKTVAFLQDLRARSPVVTPLTKVYCEALDAIDWAYKARIPGAKGAMAYYRWLMDERSSGMDYNRHDSDDYQEIIREYRTMQWVERNYDEEPWFPRLAKDNKTFGGWPAVRVINVPPLKYHKLAGNRGASRFYRQDNKDNFWYLNKKLEQYNARQRNYWLVKQEPLARMVLATWLHKCDAHVTKVHGAWVITDFGSMSADERGKLTDSIHQLNQGLFYEQRADTGNGGQAILPSLPGLD